ncbi:MAG: hypothetical protein IJN24_09115 [Bacteroidaceae bacterium]|nr:hypothetical protein [Bacteroidaceae bacterium]
MGYFSMREPRKFNHKYIYVDERKEKLNKIVNNAKRELGMLPPQETSYRERLKGAFVNETKHLKRRKEEGERFSTKTLVVAILIALYVLHYLITGSLTL